MIGKIFCALIGFSAGALVAGGVIALVAGLGGMTRFIGIGHTAKKVHCYENMVFLGGIWGNWMTVYKLPLLYFGAAPKFAGIVLVMIFGIFSGIFVGGWIMALAEVANIFPVYLRRLGLTKGLSLLVIFIALGKTVGSLLHFYMRWGW